MVTGKREANRDLGGARQSFGQQMSKTYLLLWVALQLYKRLVDVGFILLIPRQANASQSMKAKGKNVYKMWL